MTDFQITAILLCLAALGGYINQRFLRLPMTIGHMAFALIIALIFLGCGAAGWLDLRIASNFINDINFSQVLLHGMLSFLLFAGALHLSFEDLKKVGWSVGVLATFGVVLATFITGFLVFKAAHLCGFDLPYIYALLFGALISPTDPIAVLAILKQAGMSKNLYAKIGGESLFNDGMGIVVFMTILSVARGETQTDASSVVTLLAQEALGGLALGCVLGWIAYRLLRTIDEYKTEVLLTLALATGGYAIGEYIHVSAPIAMVAAGMVVGNYGRKRGMSEQTRLRLDQFWELIEETLNAVLFMLIGLHIIVITMGLPHILLGLLAIVAVLAGRVISVALPLGLMSMRIKFEQGTVSLLTWGGLRGALSIAMALSLPEGAEKSIILPMTYIVVLFSILVQGLTFRPMLAFIKKD